MSTLDYYAALARRLSPAEMARAAVRRAYRTARHKLYRPVDPSRRESVLRAFLAESPDELPERALGTRPIAAWCDVRRRASVRAALEKVPGARPRALERATRFAEGRFKVFERLVDFGPDPSAIAWSKDPSSGHVYPTVPWETLPLFENGADPKYPWSIGRLESLVALGQGYWAAESPRQAERFTQAFAGQLRSFLSANPPGHGIHWACTMEVALRGANLAQALLMFSDAATLREPGLLLDALDSLAAHGAYVEAHLEDASAVPNNHLVADYVGLMVMGLCFPELPGAARWIALASHGLREQMSTQVHPDGWSFEGSIPYHRLTTELFSLAYLFAEESGASLGASYAARLRAMFRVARDYTSEKGLSPQLGDNDSGLAFALADRQGLEQGYLAPLGAALLDAAELKPAGTVLPDEGVWLLGMEGLRRFQKLPPRATACARVSRYAGFHILRANGLLLAVSAGPNGQKGVGGHSHNDKLSFELHIDGTPVIVDPGSPVYGKDPALRNLFRSTAMHNTPQLEGREQNPMDASRLFALEDTSHARVEEYESRQTLKQGSTDETPVEVPEYLRLVTAHDGYEPTRLQRCFELFAQHRAVVIQDVLQGGGTQSVTFRFHLPDTSARLRPTTPAERNRAEALCGGGTFAYAAELGPLDDVRAVLLIEDVEEVTLEESAYSSGYGERTEALCLVARGKPKQPVARRWVLWAEGDERRSMPLDG